MAQDQGCSDQALVRASLETMALKRMDNVGIVVEDLEAVTAFFVELGMELEGEASVEGPLVDRVVGLDGVRSDVAMLRTRMATAGSS